MKLKDEEDIMVMQEKIVSIILERGKLRKD